MRWSNLRKTTANNRTEEGAGANSQRPLLVGRAGRTWDGDRRWKDVDHSLGNNNQQELEADWVEERAVKYSRAGLWFE